MFFLEPAIVSFAFGLYERKQLLKENAAAILSGSLPSALLGTITSHYNFLMINYTMSYYTISYYTKSYY